MSNCAKNPYPNLTTARLALRAIRRKQAGRTATLPTGAYLCGECRRWHLTSKSTTQTPPWEKGRKARCERR